MLSFGSSLDRARMLGYEGESSESKARSYVQSVFDGARVLFQEEDEPPSSSLLERVKHIFQNKVSPGEIIEKLLAGNLERERVQVILSDNSFYEVFASTQLIAMGPFRKFFAKCLEKQTLHFKDLNARDSMGRTPLYRATGIAEEALIKVFLERGADPNIHDKRGFTPLLKAITDPEEDIDAHVRICQLLIAHRACNKHLVIIPANHFYMRKVWVTALSVAKEKGQEGVVKALLAAGFK